MNPDLRLWVIRLMALAVVLLFALPVYGVFLEKKFTVCRDQGRDVLCDSYVVQQDDFVTKLFKQRGEISRQDMPAFLEIFKRLNPQVRNIDLIYPGQRILIPLKLIAPDTLEGQSTGTVTIPLITITNVPEKLQGNAVEHVVVAGDSVSALIAGRFGEYRSEAYQEAIEIFRNLNPDIKDLDRIRIGQKIKLPVPSIRKPAESPAVFDKSGQPVAAQIDNKKPAEALVEPKPEPVAPQPAVEGLKPEKPSLKPAARTQIPSRKPHITTVFEKAARIFQADLMDKGEYFFHREGEEDLRLALSETPVMGLGSGKRVLFVHDNQVSEYDQAVIKSYWKNLIIVRIMENASLRELLTPLCPVLSGGDCTHSLQIQDAGVSVTVRGDYIYDSPDGRGKVCLTLIEDRNQATPQTIHRYLDGKNIQVSEWIDAAVYFGQVSGLERGQGGNAAVTAIPCSSPEGFIEGLAAVFGFEYQKNVEVSFPYAGFQIKTLSNLLIAPSGQRLLVDYGDLYGDAVESMETTGFHVIQIKKGADAMGMAKDLLNGLSIPFEENHVFWVADRPRIHNTSIRTPGVFIPSRKTGQPKVFIALERIPEKLLPFFNGEGIQVVCISR